jgi:antitoxin ParD1/3/4
MKSNAATTMNVSLPAPLRERLDAKVQRLGSYGSTSEYLRELIRRDLQQDAIEQVDQLLFEGLNSGPAEPMNAAWRKARRDELAKHQRPQRSRKTARS